MDRREFLQVLAIGISSGVFRNTWAKDPYDLPRFGNVHLLHFTDCHAQLLPCYFREPDTNLGVGAAAGQPPHLTGEALLKHFRIKPGSADAHAFTSLDFTHAARIYGMVGGFAHLATLIKRLKAGRPGALLLDGGDIWQGSATALWTQGEDMMAAARLLGVDLMTGHWDFTLGAERVLRYSKQHGNFIAQNVLTNDFEDAVFPAYAMREMNGVPIAIIGQAYPYTPIANPRYYVPDWGFGIRETRLQQIVGEVRVKGAQAVVLLSHNGMDIDLKLAGRVRGIDAILGGHTHDGVPTPTIVPNAGGKTLVTNAGSNGKFLAVLDLDVRNRRVEGFKYKLMPVFSNLLPADAEMLSLIENLRAPFKAKLEEPLAVSEALLYRRGNFNGSFDQLILDALMEVKGAEIAFSPGFRWGTTLLPGQAITRERLMDQTAIAYPMTTLTAMSGAAIKTVLEDICDNLFNPDPYLQQGGDMVRVGGMTYACDIHATIGSRISAMSQNGKPIEADKTYKVAGWAPVSEEARDAGGPPIWDIVEPYLRSRKTITTPQLNLPRLI
ncbi:MAG TPA: thiosulfohydrolase SoxB [Burkholderiales bacterium]|nr:thiosulfohydrolase SoxB [Burkholderiales bacterium]